MPKDLQQWGKGFDKHLSRHSLAQKALNRVGPDKTFRQSLPAWLYVATNPDPRAMRQFVDELIPSRKRIERVARLLEKAAVELNKIESNLEILGFRAKEEERKTNTKLLIRAIELHARSLRELPIAPLSKRMSYRQFWKPLPFMICAELMRRSRGKVSFADLAYLMEAAYAGHGLEKDVQPETLGRKYSRYLSSKMGRVLLHARLLDIFLPVTPLT